MMEYKCQYKHCLHPNIPISPHDVVLVGTARYHKDCAELRATIERTKRVIFEHVKEMDYVQTMGVINSLIFAKEYDAEYVEFMAKYLAVHGAKINSPYSLYYTAKNKIIIEQYNDPTKRQKVLDEYDYRYC